MDLAIFVTLDGCPFDELGIVHYHVLNAPEPFGTVLNCIYSTRCSLQDDLAILMSAFYR